MAKKRKAREPVAKTRTYLKYGFANTMIESYYCPRCRHLLNAGPDYQPRYCDQCGQRVGFDKVIWKEPETIGYVEGRYGG